MSGTGSPKDNFVQAEITASAGAQDSNDGLQDGPVHSSSASAGTATAPKPGPLQSLSVKLQLAHPQAFSVYLSSPDRSGVTLISVEVHIYTQLKEIFHTVVSHDPVELGGDDHVHIFPFSDAQLSHVMPHLKVGNMVEVKIKYRTVRPGELKIGIISRKHHRFLGQVVEHLLHLKSKH